MTAARFFGHNSCFRGFRGWVRVGGDGELIPCVRYDVLLIERISGFRSIGFGSIWPGVASSFRNAVFIAVSYGFLIRDMEQ